MKLRDVLGLALILAVMAVAAGAFYAADRLAQARYDADSLCPLDGASGAAVIVVDKSDPLTREQVEGVRREILAARDGLPIGAKIKIAVIENEPGGEGARVRLWQGLCNPGAEANPLYENPKLVRARYDDAFRAPLERNLASLLTPGTAPQSPISAGISAALTQDAEIAQSSDRRLLLVSDLLQHADGTSAYTGTLSEEALRASIGAAGAWLNEAQIRVLLLPREQHKARQDAALAIWRGFFNSVGAEFEIVPLL